MSEPKFSDEEMRAIIRTAAERSPDEERRHSLTDIEQIASEVGIPATWVREAAASVTSQSATQADDGAKAAGAVQLVRRVSRTASEDDIHEALATIRQQLGNTGATRQVGGAVEWYYDSGFSAATVSILPAQDSTVVRLDARADGRQFVLYFIVGAATVFAGFVVDSVSTGTAGMLTTAGLTLPAFFAVQAWWKRSVRRMSNKLIALADTLSKQLGDGRR